MDKAYTTLVIIYILLTITPRLARSECNDGASLCWNCSSSSELPSATYTANLKQLLLFSNLNFPNGVGYYNESNGTGSEDRVTVVGLCRGDLEMDRELCRSCLNSTGVQVLGKCPDQKEAFMWAEKCTVMFSNDSRFNQTAEEPFQVLVSPNKHVDTENFIEGLKFLLGKLIENASSDGGIYASGSTNITESTKIYSLVQCLPSLSQKECSDCLSESSSRIPDRCNDCAGFNGARILKPRCTLQYENSSFYTDTKRTLFGQDFSTPNPPITRGLSLTMKIVISVVSSAIGVTLIIVSIWIFLKKRKNKPIREKLLKKEIGSAEPSQFDFSIVRAATEDFSEKNKLGAGGFGPVYKGSYNGQDIAVKRLSKTSQQGDLEFKNEVKFVANLQHRNLVRLLGFCLVRTERLLVYEYVHNLSLDKFIFDPIRRAHMDWDTRYKIIEGIARGINYLHEDSYLKIIHRDLKASNILLDKNMNPKISDFGLAKLFEGDQTQDNTNRIAGTYGYMAPEYAVHGKFSTKSDVYSFGVLLLEIVSGQKNNSDQCDGEEEWGDDLLTNAWKIWRDRNYSSLIDPVLLGCSRIEEIIRCVQIGLLCVQRFPAERPTVNSVLHMLNTHSEILAEPSKPALFMESTYFGSAVAQSNDSNSVGSIQGATNDANLSNSKQVDPH